MIDLGVFLDHYVLVGLIILFLSSVLFTAGSFSWVKILVENFHASPGLVLAFGCCNGSIAVVAELLVKNPIPSVLMSLVPVVTVLELWLVSRDRAWAYLFILSAFLLNFSAVHNLAVAAINVRSSWTFWEPTSLENRITIFILTLLLTSGMLFLLRKFMPARELFSLMHSREESMILMIYMFASSGVIIVASWVTTPILFRSDLPNDISIPIHIDLILKDLLLLACSYMITLLQCRSELILQRNSNLDSKLQKEKNYRSTQQQQSIVSYVADIRQNRLVEGMECFADCLRGNPPDDYQHILREFTHTCVHLEDQATVLEQSRIITEEWRNEDVGKRGSIKAFRIRMSGPRLKDMLNLPEQIQLEYKDDNPWIWFEVRLTIVVDKDSILAYVDLVDVNEQVAREAVLLAAAQVDVLTGIYNRSALEQNIRRYLSRESPVGSLFMIDLDNFKRVNDTLGHQAGDNLLADVARGICHVFREEDIVGRIGGDEFCVFAVGLRGHKAVSECARRLIRTTCSTRSLGDGTSFQTTLSIGIAICPEYGQDYETLYEHSDIALYLAKRGGKNMYRIYSGEEREIYKGQ